MAVCGRMWRMLRRPGAMLWASQAWPGFKLGYMTALDDIERTGLRPNREDTKERAAERAFRRYAP